jgi:hypothetical protein
MGLGIVLILFYITFITARTYYNPAVTLLIMILGVFIAIAGVLSPRWLKDGSNNSLISSISRLVRLFPTIFILAILTLSADVLLTTYAISIFGTSIEANRVVVGLIKEGAFIAWIGQQFTPILIAAFIFGLIKHIYVRMIITFFTIGTLGYALAVIINNTFVIFALSS